MNLGVSRDRHASWLELYFDLVFVVAIAQLSAALVHDPTVGGFARFVGLYVPVWWAWVGFAIFCARFAFDDWAFRILMMGAMLGVAALAVVLGSFDGHSAAFALAFGSVRMLLVAMYVLARGRVPQARELSTAFATGFGVAAVIWLASIAVPTPGRYVMWAVGMSIGVILTPLLSTGPLSRTPVSTSHVPERFGLFMIIVLGESVLAVVIGTAHTHWNPAAVVVAVAAFVCAACLWCSYFDFASRAVETGLLKSVRSGTLARNVYSWGHFPIAVGLTLLGAGTELAIMDTPHGSLGAAARVALFGGVVLYLVAVSLVVGALARSFRAAVWPRLPVALVVGLLGLLGANAPAAALVVVLAAVLVAQTALEVTLARDPGRRRDAAPAVPTP